MSVIIDLEYTNLLTKQTEKLEDHKISMIEQIRVSLNPNLNQRTRHVIFPITMPNEPHLDLFILYPTENNVVAISTKANDCVCVQYQRTDNQQPMCFWVDPQKPFYLKQQHTFVQKELGGIDLNFEKIVIHNKNKNKDQAVAEIKVVIKRYEFDETSFFNKPLSEDYRILKCISGDDSTDNNSLYTIFLGVNNKTGVKVAIKRPHNRILGTSYRDITEKMRKSIQVLAGHPYIPPVIDIAERAIDHAGVASGQIAFIIMQYIEGETLTKHLSAFNLIENPFSVEEKLEIMWKLADTLEYLHNQKVVHRGVSPSNIMIHREKNTFHLLGFGYSKLFWEMYSEEKQYQASISTGSIRTRIPPKTLDFMSPEFFDENVEFDIRGDIYSLGAVFYRLFANMGPYIYQIVEDKSGNEDRFDVYCDYFQQQKPALPLEQLKATLSSEIYQHESGSSTKFHEEQIMFFRSTVYDLNKIDQQLRMMISNIIEKCLEIDKQKRYQSIGEFKKDLQMLITSNSIAMQYQKISQSDQLQMINQRYLHDLLKNKKHALALEGQRKILELEKQLGDFRDTLANKNQEIQRRDEFIAEKNRQIQSKENIIQEQRQIIQELQGQTATSEDVAASLNKQCQELEKSLQVGQKTLEHLENSLVSMEQELEIYRDSSEIKSLDVGTKLPGSGSFYYTLQKELGKGGMGVVYLAERSDNSAKVALKILKKPGSINEGVEITELENYLRFLNEIFLLTNLDCHYILRGYDCILRGYLYYSVTEFIEGSSLLEAFVKNDMKIALGSQGTFRLEPFVKEEIQKVLNNETQVGSAHMRMGIDRKPIDFSIAREIVLQIAKGLQYLEFKGIVHRDLKPANIMVSKLPVKEDKFAIKAKLIDFGIALKQSDSVPLFRFTGVDEIIGTFDYMDPRRHLDNEASSGNDIFSLGVIYYEMLTGHNPYTLIRANNLDQLMEGFDKIMSPRLFNDKITPTEELLLKKMLAVKNRFESTQDLVEVMEDELSIIYCESPKKKPEKQLNQYRKQLNSGKLPEVDQLKRISDYEIQQQTPNTWKIHSSRDYIAQVNDQEGEFLVWVVYDTEFPGDKLPF